MNKDFEIRVTRGTGPGGQHKNKVETCVIITHIPTGLKEKCQDTMSKARNQNIALERLKKRIKQHTDNIAHQAINKKRIDRINKGVVRTYNYKTNIVLDHRIGIKRDLKRFMKGEIEI